MLSDDEFTRRAFLQVSATAAARAGLTGGTEQVAAQELIKSVTTSPVHGLVKNVAVSLLGMHEFELNADTTNNVFTSGSSPESSEAFYTLLSKDIDGLFSNSATLMRSLHALQASKEVAADMVHYLDDALRQFRVWRDIHTKKVTVDGLRTFIASDWSDEHKVNFLKGHNAIWVDNEKDIFNWNQPAVQVLAAIDEKLVGIGMLLDSKGTVSPRVRDFLESKVLFLMMGDKIPGHDIQVAADEQAGKAFNMLARQYGFKAEQLSILDDALDFPWMDNQKSDRKRGIELSLNTPPEDIFRRTIEVVRAIPRDYERDLEGNLKDYIKHPELLREVCKTLPEFVETILPKMLAKHFPEMNLPPKKKPYQAAGPYVEDDDDHVRALQREQGISSRPSRRLTQLLAQEREQKMRDR